MEEYLKLKKGETIGVMKLFSQGENKYKIFGKGLKGFNYNKELDKSGIVFLTYKPETEEELEGVRKFLLNKFKEVEKSTKSLDHLKIISDFYSKEKNLEKDLRRLTKLKENYSEISQFINHSDILSVVFQEANKFYEEFVYSAFSQKGKVNFEEANDKLNSIYQNAVDSQKVMKSVSGSFL